MADYCGQWQTFAVWWGPEMKKRPNTKSELSAAGQAGDILGELPPKSNSVQAEVLSLLLKGRTLTGMESVFKSSTTRLAAHVHTLCKKYGWEIEARERATGCTDGRLAYVAEYRLPPDALALASARRDIAEFCKQVHRARLQLRKHAAMAERIAAMKNKARGIQPSNSAQFNLWGDV